MDAGCRPSRADDVRGKEQPMIGPVYLAAGPREDPRPMEGKRRRRRPGEPHYEQLEEEFGPEEEQAGPEQEPECHISVEA